MEADVAQVLALFQTNYHIEMADEERAIWHNTFNHAQGHYLRQAAQAIIENEVRMPKVATMNRYMREAQNNDRGGEYIGAQEHASAAIPAVREMAEDIHRFRKFTLGRNDYTFAQAVRDIRAENEASAKEFTEAHMDQQAADYARTVAACDMLLATL